MCVCVCFCFDFVCFLFVFVFVFFFFFFFFFLNVFAEFNQTETSYHKCAVALSKFIEEKLAEKSWK
jgi:hypothetical protein